MVYIDDKNFKSQIDLFVRNEMNRLKNEKNFNKKILPIFNQNDQSISSVDYNQNPIMALLKGPDTQYKKILMNENEQFNVSRINDQCRDKNSFLQIRVRPLNAKQQKRLLKKQYHKLFKHYCQSIKKKEKCLHFTFPITYPCPMKSKKKQTSITSNSSISSSSLQQSNSQLSNNLNQLKSAVSILFTDDKNDDISRNKIPKENLSSSLLNIPSKKISTHKIHSSNAYIQKHICQLCGSILSNGICSCIVQNLLKLNNTKENHILVQFNDIFENLTSNNIIT